jgi:hypothetical protein
MNRHMTVLTIAVVFSLFIQAYLIFQLTNEVNRLDSRYHLTNSQQFGMTQLPILGPKHQGCEPDIYDYQRESL